MILKNAPKVPHAVTNNKVTTTITTTIANTGRIPQDYLGTIDLSSRSASATALNTFMGHNGVTEHTD